MILSILSIAGFGAFFVGLGSGLLIGANAKNKAFKNGG